MLAGNSAGTTVTAIERQPASSARDTYDVIIVGGGIYGAMLLLEASRCGQRALLLERQDFGAGTSYNSLRIIHGGLRYLQSMDLPRFRESVAERQWLLRYFPDLVRPLPCLMPLYNRGVKRPAVLRTALWMNDRLSARRNNGLAPSHAIANGRVLDAGETRRQFPGVITDGLTGAALWYDAHVPDSQRLVMEVLRWACSLGGKALNYVEVTSVLQSGGRTSGVQARDCEDGAELEFTARNVINATGPGSRTFAAAADTDIPELFQTSLAWNILFDTAAPSDCALALTTPQSGGHMYFLHPWKGRLFAGTGHAPHRGTPGQPTLDTATLDKFIDDMNRILPGENISADNIVRIHAGFLPVTGPGSTTLTKRAVIRAHGDHGGPQGLFSVSGNKLTTARRVAEQTLRLITGTDRHDAYHRPADTDRPAITDLAYDWLPDANETDWSHGLRQLIREESVVHLDDLVLRRCAIGDNPARTRQLVTDIAKLFDWDEQRRAREVANVLEVLATG